MTSSWQLLEREADVGGPRHARPDLAIMLQRVGGTLRGPCVTDIKQAREQCEAVHEPDAGAQVQPLVAIILLGL